MNSQTLSEQAVALHRSGRLAEAERLYLQVLADKPDDFTARHLLGVLRAQAGRMSEALADINAALAIRPDDAEALLNHANVLKSLNRLAEALADFDRALALRPGWSQAENNRGTVLQAMGRYEEALAAYDRALAAAPGNVEALNNRGSVLQDLRRPGEALAAYDQALRLAPQFATAFNNRGSALLDLKRFVDALFCFDRALALRPGDPQVLNNRGNALQGLLRYDEAVAMYDQALVLSPGYAEALNNRGNALQQLKRHDEALASFDLALASKPEAFAGAAIAALNLCDWTRCAEISAQMAQRIGNGETISPWTLLAYSDDEMLQRQAAANVIAARFPSLPPPLAMAPYKHDKIRLAYISSDKAHHPVATQVVQLIERHDRTRFDVIGIGTNQDDGSAQRRRLVAAFDTFIDAHDRSAAAVAQQLKQMEVDVLVDLNGHTRGDNFDILSHRPAPVQATWLGYAGTTAAPFVDYLIADRVVAPNPQAFSETIASLPMCFFPSDTSRSIGTVPTRAEAQLPEDGFVFCCFNNNFKITASVFATWLRLLAALPGSVLWLKQAGDKAKANLRQAAQAQEVDPARLIFAKPAPLDVHLARHRLADLFLDTHPYNAHATACDALWAGLPVVTRRGGAFAARVSTSLLTAAGLPELIAESAEEYETLALALARDPARLKACREKLAAGSLLFDTPRLARDLETLYREMLSSPARA
ncbi:MAG: tetratricopeptide repeat protein [Alphaproteobacteria bacterium]|nr:tetratricopeptide repeat protein [Alphaproteobacteria bacterium]